MGKIKSSSYVCEKSATKVPLNEPGMLLYALLPAKSCESRCL